MEKALFDKGNNREKSVFEEVILSINYFTKRFIVTYESVEKFESKLINSSRYNFS